MNLTAVPVCVCVSGPIRTPLFGKADELHEQAPADSPYADLLEAKHAYHLVRRRRRHRPTRHSHSVRAHRGMGGGPGSCR